MPSRGAETRAAIVAAAESLFAERGFEGTRLADVAERVGIRRPAIAYYFEDKQAVYEAVLQSLFGGLLELERAALLRSAPLAERIETAVDAWVRFVGERPAFARILLREVAAGTHGRAADLLRHIQPFVELAKELEANEGATHEAPIVDPIQFASMIAGSTVFLVAAMPVLVPDFDPLDPVSYEAHRAGILRLTRRLLGIRPVRAVPEPSVAEISTPPGGPGTGTPGGPGTGKPGT